jgi:ATP-dependent Clp protease protease subunit
MAKPIRCFDGNSNPFEPFWSVKDAILTESGEPELEFYGLISEFSWFQDDITPAIFKNDLYTAGNGKPVTIRMNSAGGDVIAASVIKSIIQEYPGRVTVKIDGLAASAATIVAMAGDVVTMRDSAYFMIHDPWTIAAGNVEDLKKAIDMLKSIKAGIVDSYESKTKIEKYKIEKMMSDETWMSASEAKELGFIDDVITSSSKIPSFQNSVLNVIRNYVNVPAGLLKPDAPDTIKPETYPADKNIKLVALGGI